MRRTAMYNRRDPLRVLPAHRSELVHRVGREHRWRPHRVRRCQPVQPGYRHAAAGRCELRWLRRATFRRRHRVINPDRHRAARDQRLPDRDGVSRPTTTDSVERHRQVQLLRVDEQPRRPMDGGGRLARPLHPVRHRHGHGSGDPGVPGPRVRRDADDRPRRSLFRVRQLRVPPGRPGHDVGIVPPDATDAHPRHACGRRYHQWSHPQRRRSRQHSRPQHPTRRDRQPRAQDHRRRRRAGVRRFRRAPQRHGRRPAWPRLRGGDPEGGRLLRRPGDLRRPGIGPGWRAGHIEPQRRRRRRSAQPRPRPCRCGREDPHLQLVGAHPHGRRRCRLDRHPRHQRQWLGIHGRRSKPHLRQPERHRYHRRRVRRGRDPIRCRSAVGPAFRRRRRRSSST